MAVAVLYQGLKFNVDAQLGDRYAVQDHIQQQIMMTRFIEAAWVEGAIEELPSAWLPRGNARLTGNGDAEGEASTAATYTVHPERGGEAVVFNPFISLKLEDGSTLRILVHDSLDIAVLGD